jgi:hypothetical protein
MIVLLDRKENIEDEALDSSAAFLTMNTINLSIPLPKSKLLRFYTTVKAANN